MPHRASSRIAQRTPVTFIAPDFCACARLCWPACQRIRVFVSVVTTACSSKPGGCTHAGGRVTASDLTPELLTVGEARAQAFGAAIEWVEADAEELPFPDKSFDVVLSCIGAMFAPDHARTAAELLRVCRPDGQIAMANWTPGGYGGAFFQLLGRYATEAPVASTVPATAWGDPDHVRGLLGDAVEELRCEPRTFAMVFDGTRESLFELYRDCFGPVLRLRAALVDQPAQLRQFDDDLRDFLRGEDISHIEYLAVTARRKP